ncbi:hypothetical protein CYFUS_005514 [Cystobacter fuscus]|uniref:Uncharacterized protein n=1 Tax=Cystobacter fuscus TaxID=43 RepID=A0A250JA45_9BACT|nr:hypothetical protein [Cystobacter fuscus]ATB40066.1 hypothetical protein CYFUS_005514 [Cystobacter fuscus]
MDTLDTRLTGLALCWLITQPKRKGSRSKLEEALGPLVEHHFGRAQWKQRCPALVEHLRQESLVSVGPRGGLTLSDEGLARGLRLLGTEARPRGLTWKKFKATYLQALGLGLPSSPTTLAWLADADGFRAALLQRQLGGGGKPHPTLLQVRDRLLWRQLGVDTHRPFTLSAVQAHLLGSLLELDVTDPDHALEQLAARAVGATRVDADAVRLANARAWLLSGEQPPSATEPPPPETPAPAPRPSSAPSFAEQVLATARALPAGHRFGPDKVFIAHVWRALQPEWRDRESFNAALLEANRTRRLSLSRADLVSAMDPRVVSESEVRTPGARFHFVVVDSPAQETP